MPGRTEEELEALRAKLEQERKALDALQKQLKQTKLEQEKKEAEIQGREEGLDALREDLEKDKDANIEEQRRLSALEKNLGDREETVRERELDVARRAAEFAMGEEPEDKEVELGATSGIEKTYLLNQMKIMQELTGMIGKQNEFMQEESKERKKKKTTEAGKRINPPIFEGKPGERPEAHLLIANDWMESIDPSMSDNDKIKFFNILFIIWLENGMTRLMYIKQIGVNLKKSLVDTFQPKVDQ